MHILEAAMSTRAARELLERARRIDGEIRVLARRQNKESIEIANRLLVMKEEGLATALGYASVAAYADHVLAYRASKTRDMIAMARALRELPAIRESAERGDLPWTKVRAISHAASASDEGEWLERAKTLSKEQLENAATAARGEEVFLTVTLKVTPEQGAD